ncbi:MAG: cation diffusion facilitator CzcD-associated flavoprotein CzcO, partial [Bradymonadia bacterium]
MSSSIEEKSADYDVLVIGAGISGISAAYHLQTMCPDHTFAILERRAQLGGTWDLFRYPGIRSDSDMHTLGFRFQPWARKNSIADGDEILDYLNETATEHGIGDKIQFGVSVRAASWSTSDALWTVSLVDDQTGEERVLTCRFLWSCAGYYDYDRGHAPSFEGSTDFSGELVHPQHWPEELDYAGKRIVVIGSGATAVTLVPALAEEARHVTMLQRSPSYVVSLPRQDPLSKKLLGRIPDGLFHSALRWKSIAHSRFLFWFARRYPERAREEIMKGVREQLGPDFDADTHFTPAYDPWDQRVCMTPDDAFFDALKEGSATVVTDQIERLTPGGVLLKSGEELTADIIVTATGLKLQILGGLELSVDGVAINPHDHTAYKG